MNPNADPFVIDRRPIAFGAIGGVLTFVLFTLFSMSRGTGGFEYALDDVYIHLAMADQIAMGGYGVNEGELASAASSPLYPLLLTPFAGTELQRWLPLFWNVLAIMAGGALFGLALSYARLGIVGAALAGLAPFGLNMYVSAFTGMENMAHGAASLAIVLGLWRFVETGRLGAILIVGVILAPAFRLEGVALSLAAAGTVFLLGSRRSGIFLALAGIAPVALFAGTLLSLGLDPLPNSVVAKLSESSSGDASVLQRIADRFVRNTGLMGGKLLLSVSLAVLCLALLTRGKSTKNAIFGFAVGMAGIAHLAAGSIGWMDRYENYILISQVAALVLLLSNLRVTLVPAALVVTLVACMIIYLPRAMGIYSWNVAAMQLQQGQMARFAKEHLNAPVAVNDLGQVSWRNPHYVLDLWGLASSEALQTRLAMPEQGWAEPLVRARDVPMAMIYDRWLSDAVPSNWVALGRLEMDLPRAFIGGYEVKFYATDADHVARLQEAIDAWTPGLPERASFVAAGGSE